MPDASASCYLQEAICHLWLCSQLRSKIQVCCMRYCIIKIFGALMPL